MTALDQELDKLRTIRVPSRPPIEALVQRVDRRRRRRRIGLGAAFAAAVALASVGVGSLIAEDDVRVASDGDGRADPSADPGFGVVPDVVGFTLSSAVEAMGEAGLAFSVHEGDAAFARAVVVATEPGAGADIGVGAAVGARTALPDPPVDVECPDSRHPRGSRSSDGLPRTDGLDRGVAEGEVLKLREQVPDSSETQVFIGIWDRWAYDPDLTVSRAKGYQVIVVSQDPTLCPGHASFQGVPVTHVVGPLEEWAGDPLVTNGSGQPYGIVQALATELGCDTTSTRIVDPDEPVSPVESLDCRVGEAQIGIQLYRSDDDRDRVIDYLHQFDGFRVIGPAWIVAVNTPEAAHAAAAALSGEVIEL